ncbi:hypothetical protein [Botrimarina hoheduenensis]|uniref:Phospholipase C/D domain-containing protein n=1 Tax=Botrimarina hoheduenensis TaxID=2528000 RepID=A0A5C5WCA3_9BACT|nr:hypothetical protein [Botrimarina hoheduenensis]TWT47661.1 hypothetical protein Pla111_12800 [Botrimarina hoheduenensis]
MNYLAHALPLVKRSMAHQPPAADLCYAIAGVAIPDWLGVAARRVKCRSKHARPLKNHADPRLAALACGVIQHHTDDGWFHESRAFSDLSLAFAKQLRGWLGEQTAMRPWFVGHILVEMLLDAAIDDRYPGHLDRYYELLTQVDPQLVGNAVQQMTGQEVPRLPEMIERFIGVRFLEDYRANVSLLMRLNQVMGRVGLEPLPAELAERLPSLRGSVSQRLTELLSPPAVKSRVA